MPEPIVLPPVAMDPNNFSVAKLLQMMQHPGVDPNYQDGNGRSALHTAAFFDNAAALDFMLYRNGNPNLRDHVQGATPAHVAFGGNHPAAVRALLRASADLTIEDKEGLTPLQYAERNNAAAALQAYEDHQQNVQREEEIEIEPDVNRPDALGRRGLHVAALYGNGPGGTVKALLAAEADPNAVDHVQGATPLHLACGGNRYVDALRLLAAGADVAAEDKEGLTPEDYARRNEAEAGLQALTDHESGEGERVLAAMAEYEAALEAYYEAMEDNDYDEDQNDPDGEPALPQRPDTPPVGNEGVNYRDALGRTKLHMAVQAGHLDGVHRMIADGVDVNAREHQRGVTPLHLSMGGKFQAITAELLEAGADPGAEDRDGLTPIDYAQRAGAEASLAVYRAHQADGGRPGPAAEVAPEAGAGL